MTTETTETTKRFLTAVATVAALAMAAPAGAIITGGGCLADVFGSQNCTANDVTFVVVGLGVQDDGCVGPSDTVSIFLQGTVRNTTANQRYDIGLWIATDGDPNGDGANTGVCARDRLFPLATQNNLTCGSGATQMDLLRQFDNYAPFDGIDNGPYLNLDGDSCGDLNAVGNGGCDLDGNGQWDDSVVRFTEALTFPCDDADANGFVEIPTCATWGNQERQVGGNTCDSEAEVGPGTPAKCRCEIINSTIPTPVLGFNCTSPSQSLGQGQTGTFGVTYSNASTCTPDGTMPEREQCGTASFVFYVIDYDQTKGTVSNISAGSGTFTHDTINGTITWIPASSSNGTAGIVGPGDSATLTYDFTYTANLAGDTVSASTTSYWTNTAADLGDPSASGVVAQDTLSCNAAVTATPVTLSSFKVASSAGSAELRWTTATELANLGFNVYAETPNGWSRVNDEIIPSKVFDSTAPSRYALDLGGVQAGRFMIEDVALDGTTTLHGPFRRTKGYGKPPVVEAVDWAGAKAAASLGRKGKPAAALAVRLLVDRDGIQRVTFEELAAAGFDLSDTPSAQLALFHGGSPVPIRVEPAGGKLGPGSYVELVGEALDTLYTGTNVYVLTRDPQQALRIPEDHARAKGGAATTAYQETLRVERDRVYSVGSPGDDPWYDTRIMAFAGTPAGTEQDVVLDGYVPGAGPVSLDLEIWGTTSWPEPNDHHAAVYWNGTRVGEARWDAQVVQRIQVPLPASAVTAGTNRLRVELRGDTGVPWDIADLEGYSVTYPRQLTARAGALGFRAAGSTLSVGAVGSADASVYRLGASGPVRVTGTSYAAATGALSFPGSSAAADYRVAAPSAMAHPGVEAARDASYVTAGAAEYLVISHAAFLDGLGPLVTAREAQGLAVKTVDVADVYAAFGDGIVDPDAIRDYVAYAARQMGTRYVLLVGGDTFDYHDVLGLGSVSFIPSLYVATGPIVRFAPADPLFADVDGDRIPDLAIGRLPVRTRAELDAVIDKILLYEGKGYGKTALFVADDRDATSGFSFSQASDAQAQALPAGWSVERAYVETLGAAGARQKLMSTIGGGVALTSFAGHSGLTQWTFSSVFAAADVAALTNGGEPTVVVQWGCWNSYHVEPRFQTLGHRFLLTEDKGAAAVLGAATLLETDSAEALSRRLTPLLAIPGVTLGDAVTAAKQDLARTEPERADAILGWTLLGDPAMAVDR
jgi:hypothetical protein